MSKAYNSAHEAPLVDLIHLLTVFDSSRTLCLDFVKAAWNGPEVLVRLTDTCAIEPGDHVLISDTLKLLSFLRGQSCETLLQGRSPLLSKHLVTHPARCLKSMLLLGKETVVVLGRLASQAVFLKKWCEIAFKSVAECGLFGRVWLLIFHSFN